MRFANKGGEEMTRKLEIVKSVIGEINTLHSIKLNGMVFTGQSSREI